MSDKEGIRRAEQSKAIVILRWAGVVPMALLTCLVVRYVVVLLGRWGMARYVDPGSLMWRVIDWYVIHGVGGALLGGVFVYVASYIAPAHKKTVATASAGFVLVVGGFLLFPSLLVRDWSAIVESICIAFGAVGTAYSIFSGEIHLNE